MNKLWKAIENACKYGVFFPYAHDGTTGKPSVTLFFAYVTFYLALISSVVLHIYPQLLMPTLVTVGFWGLAVVFYMLRRLKTFKADLDDRSVELVGEEEKENESSQ